MKKLVALLIPGLLVACTQGAAAPAPTLPSASAGHVYRDPAGWSIHIEPGWHTRPFSSSTDGAEAAGVQISNVSLHRPPIVRSGYPIQADGRAFPDKGIALVIGTDHDPKVTPQGRVATPPLSYPAEWTQGSCGATDSPCMDEIWFQAGPGGMVFAATVKIGLGVWDEHGNLAAGEQRQMEALTRMIRSLSF